MKINWEGLSVKNAAGDNTKPNEDYFIANPEHGFFIVADGVTRDPVDGHYPNPSPASKASKLLTSLIQQGIADPVVRNSHEQIMEVMANANEQLKIFNATHAKEVGEFPASAVMAFTIFSGNQMHLYYNGDCGCIIIREDQKIKLSEPQTARVIKERDKFTRRQVRLEIANNRNHPCGYGVFDGNPAAMDWVEHIIQQIIPGDLIILYSDGCEPALAEISGKELREMTPAAITTAAGLIDIRDKLRSDDKTLIKINVSDIHDVYEANYQAALKDKDIGDNFDREAEVIASLMKEKNILNYVDIGCWFGLLLNRVLAKAPGIQSLAIDAIPFAVAKARSTCIAPDRVQFSCFAIIPEKTVEKILFRIDTNDTSRSGFSLNEGITYSPETRTVKQLVADSSIVDSLTNSYVKLDLEGSDFMVIEDLLQEGIRPPVLHFEVLRRTKDIYPELQEKLRQHGYEAPDLPQDPHKFYSVICSPAHSLVLGFYPYRKYGYNL